MDPRLRSLGIGRAPRAVGRLLQRPRARRRGCAQDADRFRHRRHTPTQTVGRWPEWGLALRPRRVLLPQRNSRNRARWLKAAHTQLMVTSRSTRHGPVNPCALEAPWRIRNPKARLDPIDPDPTQIFTLRLTRADVSGLRDQEGMASRHPEGEGRTPTCDGHEESPVAREPAASRHRPPVSSRIYDENLARASWNPGRRWSRRAISSGHANISQTSTYLQSTRKSLGLAIEKKEWRASAYRRSAREEALARRRGGVVAVL